MSLHDHSTRQDRPQMLGLPTPKVRRLGQSRRASLAEAWLNVIVGYGVAVLANYLVLPLWGYQVSPKASAEIGLVFTGISLVRSYALRRLFNWIFERT